MRSDDPPSRYPIQGQQIMVGAVSMMLRRLDLRGLARQLALRGKEATIKRAGIRTKSSPSKKYSISLLSGADQEAIHHYHYGSFINKTKSWAFQTQHPRPPAWAQICGCEYDQTMLAVFAVRATGYFHYISRSSFEPCLRTSVVLVSICIHARSWVYVQDTFNSIGYRLRLVCMLHANIILRHQEYAHYRK